MVSESLFVDTVRIRQNDKMLTEWWIKMLWNRSSAVIIEARKTDSTLYILWRKKVVNKNVNFVYLVMEYE